jgi:hypothetical protein
VLLRGNMLKHSLLKRYACATTALLLLGLGSTATAQKRAVVYGPDRGPHHF